MAQDIRIAIRFQVEGFHRWPKAPHEHEYLSHRHRHMFHVELSKQVSRLDREIEVIALRRNVQSWLWLTYGRPCEFDGMSCEEIALRLHDQFDAFRVAVLEDGENGAIVE